MKCLIAIPHIFQPQVGSPYSSQNETKRNLKTEALRISTIDNLNRHSMCHWIHASLGKNKPIRTRKIKKIGGVELEIQVYTKTEASLASTLEYNDKLKIFNVENCSNIEIAAFASQKLLEQYRDYDILGYMEDDILIEDPEFFQKIKYFHENLQSEYTVIPHRCEHIRGVGDVILSGDPDGGRPDLFWDTKESIKIDWPTGTKEVYRATNPHSGCFFISKQQAQRIYNHWNNREWKSAFVLSGPLEQAASGRLLELLKIMKPRPEDYQFFMVRHLDDLWKRHKFENQHNDSF